ncbi:hypothetical protein [Mocis latipes granulovirus]|uniref:Uncharacterized protein n=1 Tax=Mocis latipes granulovirus TaxID=2072024 RepID=A0A162GVC3_9BBAC|nr:hypothetical protein [Mocis latipes granulovirus]AKR17409.1 hypothetical protein [Mocis latipes granulovirus]
MLKIAYQRATRCRSSEARTDNGDNPNLTFNIDLIFWFKCGTVKYYSHTTDCNCRPRNSFLTWTTPTH